MRSFYAACDLTAERGRVMLATLQDGKLTLSEVRHFRHEPIEEKDALQWDIPHLFEEMLAGLHAIGSYDEVVESVACTSWPSDYLLFEADGAILTPAFSFRDRRSAEGMRNFLARTPAKKLYDETGVQSQPGNTLFQLAAEKPRRLSRAAQLLPIADAFNFLLSGVPRFEQSLASATQLFNPFTRAWSPALLSAVGLSAKVLPPLVSAGTVLGPLRPEIVEKTLLDDTRVVASCSHELAAALAGLPVATEETWAFLRTGSSARAGVILAEPLATDAARRAGFSNDLSHDGTVRFSKPLPGLWLLEECRRFWKEKDREIDDMLLSHLAGSSPPFEALINPADPRLTPGDLPLKIQAICRETNQVVPRKPGPFIRCILESLALHYRKALGEMEQLTGSKIGKLYLLSGTGNDLLNRFIANAVHCAVAMAPPDAASIGNVMVQAMGTGRVKSLEEAREIVRNSLKVETLLPHPAAWDTAHARLEQLFPSDPLLMAQAAHFR
jgi:rhamnulokinase